MDPSDKSTWIRLRTNMPSHFDFDASKFAPRAWAAICELCGGEDRVEPASKMWKDSLIVNLGTPEGEGKPLDPKALGGWHVDGDFFVHYLDSPEQALLVTPLFTDIAPGGGGTVICPEAIAKVAKHLHDHPEGVSPRMVPRGQAHFVADPQREKDLSWFNNTACSCNNFVEATGQIGDVYLMHPLMLHSASSNSLRRPRIITNPPVAIKEPFRFHRDDGNYSLVEQLTRNVLAGENLKDWRATGLREAVIPERMRIQERMKREEEERLAGLKKDSASETSQQISAAG